MATSGPKAPRGEVAERILTAARESFARDGFAGSTVQGIAHDADVVPKLVRYYFGSKEALLEACLVSPAGFIESVRGIGELPIEQRGEALARQILRNWSVPAVALIMRTSLVIAVHEPIAMERVRAIFVDSLIPALGLDPADASTRARGGLIASQLLGLAFARFVYAIDQAVEIPEQVVVTQVGETIQRYLEAPLG